MIIQLSIQTFLGHYLDLGLYISKIEKNKSVNELWNEYLNDYKNEISQTQV